MDMIQIEYSINMGFSPKALKNLWVAIQCNRQIADKDKEPMFEKYSFQMIERCYSGWMKT